MTVNAEVVDLGFGGQQFTVPITQFLVAVGKNLKSVRIKKELNSESGHSFLMEMLPISEPRANFTNLVALPTNDEKFAAIDMMRGFQLEKSSMAKLCMVTTETIAFGHLQQC